MLGEDPGGGPAQYLLRARGWQSAVAQVVSEVEVRIIHPHRPPQPQRDEADLLAVARDRVELAQHHLLEARKGWRGSLENAHPANVHRGVGPLDVEKRGVRAGSSTPCWLLLQDLGQDSVDLEVDRHSGVTRLDLDLAGAGIEASPPRDDPIAARVDRNRAHVGRQRRPEVLRGRPRSSPRRRTPLRTCQVLRGHLDAPQSALR